MPSSGRSGSTDKAGGGDERNLARPAVASHFFRDREVLEKLSQQVFPELLRRKRVGGTIRIWSPDCSTGEEAYSLLIALVEYLSQSDVPNLPVQLFGTDIGQAALEKARAGVYTDAAIGDISAERRERFFTKERDGGFKISKDVRERCAFGRRDLATDPPFSRIDLVSCRNDIMSFGPAVRTRVLRAFQFALNAHGFLVLGRTETIADGSDFLRPIDDEHKIFAAPAVRSARPAHQPATDELISNNEDLKANNEDLQIANEELQAAKEELQSANDALLVLNGDMRLAEAERALLVREMEAAKVRAEQANSAKDIFLAILSHELRTPLSTLLLAADLMRTGQLDAEKLAYIGEMIARATKEQAQLIEDLVDTSRIAAEKVIMELRAVSLATVVQSAIDAVAEAVEMKRLHMRAELERALPPVSGDPVRLQQVVANLLTNAIKFTPEGGRVEVTVDAAADRGRIRVTDTGVGIAPAFLPRLFDRFSQEDRGQTRAHAGLGLGLAIVRHFVEAHGGTVHAESAGKGAGTTFTVSLPLMTASYGPRAAGEQRPVSDPISRGIEGIRVLVVEDDAATREALTMMLSLSGAQVRSAESVATAMDVFSSYGPDLLVCDVALPDGDGYTLLRRIRNLGPDRGADTPALALTALAGADDRRRAFDAGFQTHLAKPVDIERLRAALASLLNPIPS